MIYEPLSGPAGSGSSESPRAEPKPNYDNEPCSPHPMERHSPIPYRPSFTAIERAESVDILKSVAQSGVLGATAAEDVTSATGFGAGLVCLGAETLLGYPFIVLRRQCQVNRCSSNNLSPLLMAKAILTIQRSQGLTALWKGLTCHMMYEGLTLTTDAALSHVTDMPKEVPSYKEGVPRILAYFALRSISTIITLPVYSSVLLDTVQSESARFESATPISCLKEACYRLAGRGSSFQYRTLVPFHQLILPTVLYTVLWDSIAHTVHAGVLKVCKYKQAKPHSSNVIGIVWPELLASTVHSFVADLMLLPLELVMNRMHLQGTRAIVDNIDNPLSVLPFQSNYSTLSQCVEYVLEEEGKTGLFKGLAALLLQYTVRTAVLQITKFTLRKLSTKREVTGGDGDSVSSIGNRSQGSYQSYQPLSSKPSFTIG